MPEPRPVIGAVDALDAEAQLTELSRAATGAIAGNTWERVAVLEQLARVGVLVTGKPLPYDRWVTWDDESRSCGGTRAQYRQAASSPWNVFRLRVERSPSLYGRLM